ncbi:MAG: hypothetical protein WBA13_04875 [Microcoleaceae cyanobacterium]
MNSNTRVFVTFLDADKIDFVKLHKLETIAGIQQGLEGVNAGSTDPISNLIQEMQQKYEIPEDLPDLRIAKKEEKDSLSSPLQPLQLS